MNKAYVYHAKYGQGILMDKKEGKYFIDFSGEVKKFELGIWGTKLFISLSDLELCNNNKILVKKYEHADQYKILNANDSLDKEIINNQRQNHILARTAKRSITEFILLSNVNEIVILNCTTEQIETIAPYTTRNHEILNCENYIKQLKNIPILSMCSAEFAIINDKDISHGKSVITSKIKVLRKVNANYIRTYFKRHDEELNYNSFGLGFDNYDNNFDKFDHHVVTPFDVLIDDSKERETSPNKSYKRVYYYIVKFNKTKIKKQVNYYGEIKYQINIGAKFIDIMDRNIDIASKENFYYHGLVLVKAYLTTEGKVAFKALHFYENKFLMEDEINKIVEENKCKGRNINNKSNQFFYLQCHQELKYILKNLLDYRNDPLNNDANSVLLNQDIENLSNLDELFLSEPDAAFNIYKNQYIYLETFIPNKHSRELSKLLADLEKEKEEEFEKIIAQYDQINEGEFDDEVAEENEDIYKTCDDEYLSEWEEEYGYEGYADDEKYQRHFACKEL